MRRTVPPSAEIEDQIDERRGSWRVPGAKAGARALPRLVPVFSSNAAVAANRAAWERLGRWEKPFLTLFSDHDPIMRGGERAFQQHVPGAAGQPHSKVSGGHFLQEDSGPELARRINELIVADAQSRVTREPQPTL